MSKWRDYFLRLAREVSTMSTCDRAAVGAIIVRDNRVLATGYNGSPSGDPHCDDEGHIISVVDGVEHCIRTVHAEQNAICQAAKYGISIMGATLYCTHDPCWTCRKLIKSAGIVEVVVG